MEIRTGTVSEIENFQLFDDSNEGEEITIVEHEGAVVAYAQHTGEELFFLESEMSGAGRFLVDWFKSEYSWIVAHNVEETAKGFWSKMGFGFYRADGFGGEDWAYEA